MSEQPREAALCITWDEVGTGRSERFADSCARAEIIPISQLRPPFGVSEAKETRENGASTECTVVAIEDGDILRASRVRSPERLSEVIAELAAGGKHLVVLANPEIDTRRWYSLGEALRIGAEFRSKGRSAAVAEWRQKARREGVRLGRMRKCSNCFHGVNRASNPGQGHTRHHRTGLPGPCTKEGCGCPVYA